MSKQFRYFRVDQLDGVTLVTITARDFLNQLANVEMKMEFLKFAREEEPKRMIVSFVNIERFSTELIGTLLSVKKLMGEDGEIKLCCMEIIQREVFQLLKLDGTVFEIHETIDDARAAF